MTPAVRPASAAPASAGAADARSGSGPAGPAVPRRRRAARLAAAALLALLGACASGGRWPAFPAPETLPPESPLFSETLGRTDAWLRHYVMSGRADSAALLLDRASGVAPRDELLRRLQLGAVLHEAGRYAESERALAWAEAEAERRASRSVSRGAAALLVSDRAIDYLPPPPEALMIPVLRILNRLALDDAEGAAVEARKVAARVDALRAGGDDEPCVGEGAAEYLAAAAFRAAGEAADALVSLRRAERAWDACDARDGAGPPPGFGAELVAAARIAGLRDVADAATERYGDAEAAPGTGSVLVVVREGWAVHRAEEAVHLPLRDDDFDDVHAGDDLVIAEAAARLVDGFLGAADDSTGAASFAVLSGPDALVETLGGAYVLRLAWPALRRETAAPAGVRVVADPGEGATLSAEARPASDLSDAYLRDFEARRGRVLTRMTARGIARWLASREVEEKAEEEGGDALGFVVGRAVNLAGALAERADTRSWSLLPDRLALARLELPAGAHALRLEVVDRSGAVTGTVDLGLVEVRAGEMVVRGARAWSAAASAPVRFASAPVGAADDLGPPAPESSRPES